MKYWLLIICFCIGFSSKAQKVKKEHDLKVGLVLSGGGAKGFAHIGVLKAIEKSGLRIDYIGGTSMGAAIGALYASGYSAQQIDSIINHIHFMEMLTDKTARKHKTFYQKKHDAQYLVSFPIHHKKIILPLAVSKGQQTLNQLTQLFLPVSHIQDFSQLPIPFFCVATDIETGKEVEIDKGNLALAVRASASLPTLLAPCKIDGKTLIDGGISDNFPIDNMLAKEVDIIIAVDVQGNLKKAENLNSLISVLDQIVNYQLYGKESKEQEQINVYIKPSLTNIGIVDFEYTPQIIQTGELEGEKFLKTFESIAHQQKQIVKRGGTKSLSALKLPVSAIHIVGHQNYNQRYIKGNLNLKEGKHVSLEELNDKISYLMSTENFSRILQEYQINKDTTAVTIKLNILEEPIHQYLKLGVHYDPIYKLTGLVNYTSKHLLGNNDIFAMDVMVGENLRSKLNYLIDNGLYLGFGIESKWDRFDAAINTQIPGINKLQINYQHLNNYLFLQQNNRKNFAFSNGIEHKYIKSYTNTIITSKEQPRTFFENRHFYGLVSRLEFDSFNKADYPTNGYFANLNLRYLFAASNTEFSPVTQLRVDLKGVKTISNKLTFILEADGAISITSDILKTFNYSLGGIGENFTNNFVPFYGYEFATLEGNSFVKTLVSLRYNLLKNHYITAIANYAVVQDGVLKFLQTSPYFRNAKTGFALGYSTKTIIGPVDLKYAWSPENKTNQWFIGVGFWF